MEQFIYILDLTGTFVFAISGILTAVQKKFDIVGAILIGFVTALGGGTTRDLLIGATPVGWMQNEIYVYLIFAALVICYFFYGSIRKLRRSMFLFDAIGIGLFTILGIQKTLSLGLSPVIALMMGVVSATFGGVVRDILSNEVPLIFRKEVYAMACVTGGLVFMLLNYFFEAAYITMPPAIILVIVIRILAVRYHWEIPFKPLQNLAKKYRRTGTREQ